MFVGFKNLINISKLINLHLFEIFYYYLYYDKIGYKKKLLIIYLILIRNIHKIQNLYDQIFLCLKFYVRFLY